RMGIQVEGHLHSLVAEDAGDHERVDALFQQQRRARVAQRMQRMPWHTRCLAHPHMILLPLVLGKWLLTAEDVEVMVSNPAPPLERLDQLRTQCHMPPTPTLGALAHGLPGLLILADRAPDVQRATSRGVVPPLQGPDLPRPCPDVEPQ